MDNAVVVQSARTEDYFRVSRLFDYATGAAAKDARQLFEHYEAEVARFVAQWGGEFAPEFAPYPEA